LVGVIFQVAGRSLWPGASFFIFFFHDVSSLCKARLEVAASRRVTKRSGKIPSTPRFPLAGPRKAPPSGFGRGRDQRRKGARRGPPGSRARERRRRRGKPSRLRWRGKGEKLIDRLLGLRSRARFHAGTRGEVRRLVGRRWMRRRNCLRKQARGRVAAHQPCDRATG